MLEMLRELVAHKGHANAAMLTAIHRTAGAAGDPDIRDLLHHVQLANRFWLLSILGSPFVLDEESRPAPTFEALVQRFIRDQSLEREWLRTAAASDLARVLRGPLVPNGECSVAHALVQVCLHAHGHRAQCAKLLRRHGGTPPPTDFVLWLAHRPDPAWPAFPA
jgi:uncharacterized damage-inducible protein DinB